MKITVVGFWAAYPAPNGATSGYLFEAEGYTMLVDCGSAVLSRLGNHMDVNELDSVLISHYHSDHCADLRCLQHAVHIQLQLGYRKKELTAYGPRDPESNEELGYQEVVHGVEYDDTRELVNGPFHITFSPNTHERVTYAVKISADSRIVVYTSDTGWYEELPRFCSGADLLICETSLYNKFDGRVPGHLSARQVGELAVQADPKHLLLSHLPPYEDQSLLLAQARESAKEYAGTMELAREGWSMKW
jgi:ribonuclease BN (tRNA processing enzyme)